MDDFAAIKIASAGLAAQRVRMKTIAENLANQRTTGPNGPYQRKEVVLESIELPSSFEDSLDSALAGVLNPEELRTLHSVTVREVRPDGSEPIMVKEPNHPHANSEGYVAYPNINVIREMTDMMETSRSYEANLAIMKTTTDMINRAIDLLG